MSDKDISVFVDESGSFAPDSNSSRYYLICLVLHDQAADISGAVSILEDSLDNVQPESYRLSRLRMHYAHLNWRGSNSSQARDFLLQNSSFSKAFRACERTI